VHIAQGSPEGNGDIAVSPDGKLVAFIFQQFVPAPVAKLSVVPAEGSTPIKTFIMSGGRVGLRWSPDSGAVQYLLTRGGVTNIWEMPLDGSDPHQVTHFTSELIFDFDWSRDGKQLLLARGDSSSDVILLSNFR
jgi:Tol biopolymer transport system component